jgi:hypothetical protein
MTRAGIVTLVAVLAVGPSVACFFVARHYSIRRAGQAIARTSEYWNASAILYEPRYLEAEKAVADVMGDSLDKAQLRLCLSNVRLARSSRETVDRWSALQAKAMSDGSSRAKIADTDAQAKKATDAHLKFLVASWKCVEEAKE